MNLDINLSHIVLFLLFLLQDLILVIISSPNLTLSTQSFADGFRLIQRGQFFEGWHKYVFVGKSWSEMEFVDWYYCKLLLVEWKRRLSLRTPNYWHTSCVLKRCLKSKVHGQIFEVKLKMRSFSL